MTTFQVRTHPNQSLDPASEILLDWFDDRPSSTVQVGGTLLAGLAPSAVALDLFRLGGAVFCVDKVTRREDTVDGWTREIELRLPVSDVTAWRAVHDPMLVALQFLTGDHWSLQFDPLDGSEPGPEDGHSNRAVSLFSGGLDSLTGAIDLLEAGEHVTLVGHHDSSLTDHKQVELAEQLRGHYGDDRVELRRLLLRPSARDPAQALPLPAQEPENTTRSRSMLFIAAGVAVADGLGETTPLHVPENGLIGINVPLTAARAGSLSTRTTHPFFMDRLSAVLSRLGLRHELVNPYRLLTKGEMLERCANRALLADLAPRSISCSHPEAPRWRKRPQGNCGYCYPCLIRRAALHRIGEDRAGEYAWDALTERELLDPDQATGASVRALAASLAREPRSTDVLRNGRVPGGEAGEFFDLYRRGRAELLGWLRSGGAPDLLERAGVDS